MQGHVHEHEAVDALAAVAVEGAVDASGAAAEVDSVAGSPGPGRGEEPVSGGNHEFYAPPHAHHADGTPTAGNFRRVRRNGSTVESQSGADAVPEPAYPVGEARTYQA